MAHVYEGKPTAEKGARLAVVVSRFNEEVTRRLLADVLRGFENRKRDSA